MLPVRINIKSMSDIIVASEMVLVLLFGVSLSLLNFTMVALKIFDPIVYGLNQDLIYLFFSGYMFNRMTETDIVEFK